MNALDARKMNISSARSLSDGDHRHAWIMRSAVLTAMLLGALGMMKPLLELSGMTAWLLTAVCGVLTGVSLILLLPKQNGLRWAGLLAVLLWAVFCLISADPLRNAAAEPINRVLEIRQLRRNEVFMPLSCEPVSPYWFLLPFGGILGALFGLIVLYGGAWGLLLLPCVWVSAGCGYLTTDAWLALFCLACALLPLTAERRKTGGVLTRAAMLTAAMAACLMLLLAVIGRTVQPDPQPLREALTGEIHTLRYESERQVLPEGRFTGFGRMGASNASMLEVTMEEPRSLYLRSGAYSEYTADGWKQPDAETLENRSALHYWLRQAGFSGETQLAALASALGEAAEAESVTVSVTGACRELRCLPVQLTGTELLNHDTLLDGAVRTHGFTGEREYSFQLQPELLLRAYVLLDELDERQDEPAAAEYLRLEESYRESVYADDLAVPEDCAALLQTLPGMTEAPETTYEAKSLIRSIFENRALYDDTASLRTGGATLLRKLLNGEPCCSAQYATAAVLMLRQLGIPARYAEGYAITKAEASASDGSLTLTGKNAHAWAEYYEDGIGWLPFEVTPPLIGQMEEPEWQRFHTDTDGELTAGSGGETTENLPPENENQLPDEPDEPDEQPDSEIIPPEDRREPDKMQNERTPDPFLRALWWLIPTLLLLLAVLFLLLHRRKRIRERRMRFENEVLPEAITSLFAYSMELMQAAGLPVENRLLRQQAENVHEWSDGRLPFTEMAALNEEALFSVHPFSEAQREQMNGYVNDVHSEYCKKLKWPKRLYQRWFRCID